MTSVSSSRETYERFFHQADADKSGSLSYDELLSMLRRQGYRGSERKIKVLFNTADTSGDGQVSLEEYLIAMGELPVQDHKELMMRNCFKGFDKDGNGVIDKAEMKLVFREVGRYLTELEAEKMVAMADADGSGSIDYEEFINHFFGKKNKEASDD